MTRIAILLAKGFEEMEALTPADVWRRAGFEIKLISISNYLNVSGAHNITVVADKIFDETNFDTFDMLFLPGGIPGATNLDQHEGLKKQLLKFASANKTLGAICAAPLVLGHNQILKGKKATCFPGFENELIGATHTGEAIETDGNIITGKGAGVALQFALKVVSHFNGDNYAETLAAKMQIPPK